MADHCRKQIRRTLVDYLSANVVITKSVEASRVHPLDADPLPALIVSTPDEDNDIFNKIDDTMRTLSVKVEGYAIGPDVEDTLDDIAAEVEPLIRPGVPEWVKEVKLTTTEIEMSGEAVNVSGLIRLMFNIVYHANSAAPDTPL